MTLVLILGLLMNAVALPLAAKRVYFLFRAITVGQPAPDRIEGVTGRLGAAMKRQVVEVFGQKKLLKWTVPGTAHFFVMWAFFILGTVYLEAYAVLLTRDPEWNWFVFGNWSVLGFVQDFIAVMCFLGIGTFWWIRIVNNPKNQGRGSRFFGSHLGPAYFTLFMIFNVLWTLFLFRGAVEARDMGTDRGYGKAAFVSYGLGKILPDSSLLIGVGLLLHIGVMLAFLIFVLNSKHLHIFLAPLNVLFGRQPVALGAAKPMMSEGKPLKLDDLEDLDEDAKLGVGAAEDFSWKGILDFTTCTECGRCQDQCPAWNTEKPLSPKLMIMALRDHTLSKAPYLLADEDKRDGLLEGNEKLAREVERPLIGDTGDDWFYMPDSGAAVIDPDVLWSCVTCGACVQQCPVDIEHVDHIVDMRRYQVLVESNFPAELNGLFKGLENKGNPWNMSPKARMDWAKDLPFDVKVVGEDVESLDEVEWLFWVGCAGAYEDRAKKTTRAVAELLDMAGVTFAVLGNGETCTGDSARRAGNEFVFQGLAAENIATFKETKVKKVVSTCAHCFNTLKNEYSQLGIELEVVHHTQLLNRLVREKKLVPVEATAGAAKRSITYHDPCYIGRHNGVYSPPRELLAVIPDATLTEMPRNSERSFCCGAGGARMWMEETIGSRINETRTKEAVETGADQIAVGCPFCRVMLSDGLTSAQSKGEAREEVEVLDVAQMLLASIKGETAKAVPAQAKSGSAGGSGGTATAVATDDEATKAEPEAGDATQTDETVTKTEDVGPAAKASGGGSLFDVDSSSDDEAEPEPEKEAEPEAKSSGGSLFDLGDDDSSASTEKEPEPEKEAEPEAKKSDEGLGGGGSLFDIGGDDDAEESTPTTVEAKTSDADTPADEDAAGDSTTDGETDRAADDADTDVEPDEDTESKSEASEDEPAPSSSGTTSTPAKEIPEGGSLFDIEEPAEEEAPAAKVPSGSDTETAVDEDAAGDSTTDGDTDRSHDDADTDVATSEDQTDPEVKPETPTSSGTTSTPAKEIPEGGSLFDIEEPAEEEAPAAKVPSGSDTETAVDEDAAGDSTTDSETDRSQDDADTDVATSEDQTDPEVEPDKDAADSGEEGEAEPEAAAEEEPVEAKTEATEEKPAPTSSGTVSTPATSIPEGGSLFDIEEPAEEEAPAPEVPSSSGTETAVDEDAAGDSTTDSATDRSQDDADTDVKPDKDAGPEVEADVEPGASTEDESSDVPVTSLRDIKAKFSDGADTSPTEAESDSDDVPDEDSAAQDAEPESEPDEGSSDEAEEPARARRRSRSRLPPARLTSPGPTPRSAKAAPCSTSESRTISSRLRSVEDPRHPVPGIFRCQGGPGPRRADPSHPSTCESGSRAQRGTHQPHQRHSHVQAPARQPTRPRPTPVTPVTSGNPIWSRSFLPPEASREEPQCRDVRLFD